MDPPFGWFFLVSMPEYSRRTMPIPRLLTAWLLELPGDQQQYRKSHGRSWGRVSTAFFTRGELYQVQVLYDKLFMFLQEKNLHSEGYYMTWLHSKYHPGNYDANWMYPITMINSLWPKYAIWQHRSGSTLAWCLMALSHYLNQCQLLVSEVLWHSPILLKSLPHILWTNKLTQLETHLPHGR